MSNADNLVGGFVADEPPVQEPLPPPAGGSSDSLLQPSDDSVLCMCSTRVANLERHDFVEVLYRSFKLAVAPFLDQQGEGGGSPSQSAPAPPPSLAACILAAGIPDSVPPEEHPGGGRCDTAATVSTQQPVPLGTASQRPVTADTLASSVAEKVTAASAPVIPHHTNADLTFKDTMSTLDRVKVALAKALGLPFSDPLDTDFGTMALVDFYLELLYLCQNLGMTSVQVQQALLLTRDTIADISWMEKERDLEGKVVPAMHRRLVRLCNDREAAVVETKTITTTIFEEQVDPVALAAFEIAKKEAKGKKAKEMNEATLPKVQVPVTVTKEQRDPKVIIKPPYFSTREVLALLALFKVSLFQHWRLFNIVLSGEGREVSMTHYTVRVEDVAIMCTPLAEAITEEEHLQKLARNEVTDSYEKALTAAHKEWSDGVDQVAAAFIGEDAAARETFFREEAEDRNEKLNLDQYNRTVEVLKLRVAKKAKETGEKECGEGEKPRTAFKLEDDWTGAIGKRLESLDNQIAKSLQGPEAAAKHKK